MAKEKEARDMVSRSTLERTRSEAANQIEKLRKKLKAGSDAVGWQGASGEIGTAILAGSVHGALSRVAPVTLPVVGEVSGGVLAFSAVYPLARKALSNKLRAIGDKMWSYGLARAADDATRAAISKYLT